MPGTRGPSTEFILPSCHPWPTGAKSALCWFSVTSWLLLLPCFLLKTQHSPSPLLFSSYLSKLLFVGVLGRLLSSSGHPFLKEVVLPRAPCPASSQRLQSFCRASPSAGFSLHSRGTDNPQMKVSASDSSAAAGPTLLRRFMDIPQSFQIPKPSPSSPSWSPHLIQNSEFPIKGEFVSKTGPLLLSLGFLSDHSDPCLWSQNGYYLTTWT